MGMLASTSPISMPSRSPGADKSTDDKSILIMNVHPSAGLNPPGPTTADPFASDAIYELKIDTDGDAIANIAYRVRFSHPNGGTQTATLRRVEGTEAAGAGDGGQIVLEGAPVSTGRKRA